MNDDKLDTSIEDLKIVREYIRTIVKDIASRKCRMIDKVDNALELLKEKEAHWIKKSCDALYCSNCDAPSINKQPYCYRCGSRMT